MNRKLLLVVFGQSTSPNYAPMRAIECREGRLITQLTVMEELCIGECMENPTYLGFGQSSLLIEIIIIIDVRMRLTPQ